MKILIKGSRSGYINIRKSRLQSKETYHRQRGTLYNDERVNPPRRHSTPKCVCTDQESYKIYEVKMIELKRELYNHSWRPQHPSLDNLYN